MAQFGKLQGTVQDGQGNAIPGASVTIYFQGAYVTSTQNGPTYTVNDPGAIVTGVDVAANLGTTTKTVGAVTFSTINTGGGAGLGTLVNNDRIVYKSPVASVYADPQGAEPLSNPLTTDANGYWSCYAPIAPYDIIESATGYASRLRTDMIPEGNEFVTSFSAFSNAVTKVFRRTTLRTLTSGKFWMLENPELNEIASIDYSGKLTLAGALAATTGALSGNLTVGGTLGVTGNTTLSGTLGVTGLTTCTGGATIASSLTYSGAAGNLSLTAGSIETADLAVQATTITRTADGTADQAIGAGGAYTDITGCSISFTPASTSSEIVIICDSVSQSNGAGEYHFYSQISHTGTGSPAGGVCERVTFCRVTGANDEHCQSLVYRVSAAALSGSQTFKLQVKCVTSAMDVKNSTNAATFRVSRIVAMEFKR